jgi:hypothetical protein
MLADAGGPNGTRRRSHFPCHDRDVTHPEDVWGIVEYPAAPGASGVIQAAGMPIFHNGFDCPLIQGNSKVWRKWQQYSESPGHARRAGFEAVVICARCWPDPLPKIRKRRAARPREEWDSPFIVSGGLPGLGKRCVSLICVSR